MSPPLPLLPLMKSFDDAIALAEREHDNFYVTAFMLEGWLGEVTCRIYAQHSGKKSAKKRQLQQGMAHQVFTELFDGITAVEMPHLFGALARFGGYDHAQCNLLRQAYRMLSLESPSENWPDPSGPLTAQSLGAGMEFIRQHCLRLCDWVEALNHWQAHQLSFSEPLVFDPDPEKRELAALGLMQRHYAELKANRKEWWLWHHEEAAERLKGSPKWATLGRAMAATPTGDQKPAAVDQLIILFWPLLKRHGWTYRDLLNVINAILPPPAAHPCVSSSELASHCANVLGLRKGPGPQGKTASNGKPPGFEVAWKLTHPAPDSGEAF